MIEVKGLYNVATVFTNNIEDTAISQIKELCNQEFTKGTCIKIMPDVHAGAGCTIGTTMTIKDKVVPNLVGVDIGCGMLTVEIGNKDIDLNLLDKYINKNIPSGFSINEHPKVDFKDQINSLYCIRDLKKSTKEFNRAIGSLGGGNHFIEIDIDDHDNKYLIIHSGSRNIGNQVARYYQDEAFKYHSGLDDDYKEKMDSLIKEYKKVDRRKEIQDALKQLKIEHKKESTIPKDLCYLEGKLMQNYLHDIEIIQKYSNLNRSTIAKRIVEECLGLEYEKLNQFQTIHNYIDKENNVLRKGAISAMKGEKVLIPINMKDGCIVAIGKGNPEWNYSAPHGAGRIMSRSKAKEILEMDDFKNTMKDIYSSSVSENTLDEAPMAYKPIQEIIDNIKDTVDIFKIIKPIYNYKSQN